MQTQKAKPQIWSSRVGVIFAVMGSAIGLGNFLRFPGLAAKYGGGSFMIPYAVAFLLLGLPIAWAEWSLGRMGGRKGFNSSPGIFFALWKNRAAPYLGVLGLMIPIGIYMYYVYIEAWCLYYAIGYLTGTVPGGNDPTVFASFFESFTGQGRDGALFNQGLKPAVWMLLICFALNFAVVYRGLNKGIELISRVAIPVLFLCAFGVLFRVLTLGTPDPAFPERNVLNGLGFMWNPNYGDKTFLESLANPEMWLEAAGQMFFSLSVGFGIIITYASYVHQDEDIVLSGTTSAAGNLFAEVALGGLITIPAAFVFLGPENAGGSTFQLGFMTLPNVFARMALGQVVGFLWFGLLFIAAITSSISMLQPAIAFFEEGLGLGRRAAVTILGFITLVGTTFVVFFSHNLKALDMMDFWVGNVLIYLLATVTITAFAWGIGAEKGVAEAERGSLMRVPRVFLFIMRYVSPLYLVLIFVFWMYAKLPDYWLQVQTDDVSFYTLSFLIVVGVFLTMLVATAARRWRKQEGQS